jgi:hypothetical protein
VFRNLIRPPQGALIRADASTQTMDASFVESSMALVTIKIYQVDGSAARSERKLMSTLHLETSSGERLTSKRAGQLFAREFPQFESPRKGMIKSEEGWTAMRSLRPVEGCSFHYIWENAVVAEDVKSSASPDKLSALLVEPFNRKPHPTKPCS